MKRRTLTTVAILGALATILAPVAILAEPVAVQYQLDVDDDADLAHQQRYLDDLGDDDGEGEITLMPDGSTLSEASVYWICETMGNKRCN